MTNDDAKEWVTIKIPKQVRNDAREDPRTYGQIMQAGLGEQPFAGNHEVTAPDSFEFSDEDIEELKDAIEDVNAQAVDVSPGPSVAEIRGELERLVSSMEAVEERTGRIERTLDDLTGGNR